MEGLRYFAAFMTEATVCIATFAGMWAWTKKDALEILVCAIVLAFVAGLLVLLITEPEADEEEEENPQRIGPQIYTLHNGQFYGRKIG